MVKICVIKRTEFGYPEEMWKLKNFEYSSVREDIKEFLQFVEIKNLEDLGHLIGETCRPDQSRGDSLDITDFYYTDTYVLQAIANTTDAKHESIYSYLGSQLLDMNVNNDMIVIKRNIRGDINEPFPYEDIQIEDIIIAVQSLFVHIGLYVRTDGSIDSFKYVRDPLETISMDELQNTIRYHEFKLYEHILTFYVNIKSKDKEINPMASIIYGKEIRGDLMITLRNNGDTTAINMDLTQEIFTKIYDIYLNNPSYDYDGELYMRKFTNDPNVTSDTSLEIFPTVSLCPNFFWIVNREHNRIGKQMMTQNEIDEQKNLIIQQICNSEGQKVCLNNIE